MKCGQNKTFHINDKFVQIWANRRMEVDTKPIIWEVHYSLSQSDLPESAVVFKIHEQKYIFYSVTLHMCIIDRTRKNYIYGSVKNYAYDCRFLQIYSIR